MIRILIACSLLAFIFAYSPSVARADGDGCPPIDPENSGLPPCCERVTATVDLPKRYKEIEARIIADPTHEYLVIMDCVTGRNVLWGIGGPYEVTLRVDLRQTWNELMIHSHGAGTMPSVEDMQNLHDTNPLEFVMLGYDAKARNWQRCIFKKPGFLSLWPEIDSAEAYRLKSQGAAIMYSLPGLNYEKANAAWQLVWVAWAAEHGVSLRCGPLQ